jgi:hypothetical protein
VKLVGGVSAKDATTMAREMRTDPEFLQSKRKHRAYTEFACFIRNVTPHRVSLSVPFGQMEARPRMSEAALGQLLARNRQRYCAMGEGQLLPPSLPSSRQPPAGGFEVGDHEVL